MLPPGVIVNSFTAMTEALNTELVMQLRVASAATAAQGIRQFELGSPHGAELPEIIVCVARAHSPELTVEA